MKLHEQREFLQDVLGDDAIQALRQDSLQQGLAALRRKRRQQLLTRSAVFATIPLLVCVLLLTSRLHPHHPITSLESAPDLSSAPATVRGVKVINDQQLFSLFPNRSLALVGKPGHQQLIFLDQL